MLRAIATAPLHSHLDLADNLIILLILVFLKLDWLWNAIIYTMHTLRRHEASRVLTQLIAC